MPLFRSSTPPPSLPSDPNVLRRHIVLYGRVQGVGLRFRVSTLAKRLGLTGWVKNEDDGSVSMELQGTAEQMDQLFAELRQYPYIRIQRIQQEQISLEAERGFRAQY